jgi:hypothetical protein
MFSWKVRPNKLPAAQRKRREPRKHDGRTPSSQLKTSLEFQIEFMNHGVVVIRMPGGTSVSDQDLVPAAHESSVRQSAKTYVLISER